MKNLPKTRTENVVVQTLGKETLIYDLTTHKAFNLNETSSIIFNACNGKTTFDELKQDYKFADDLIFLALDELKKNNLIEADNFVSPFTGMSRREVIKKVGFASMVALPVIASLVAPTAAMAQSGCLASQQRFNAPPGTCGTATTNSRCCSGVSTLDTPSGTAAPDICICS